MQGTATIPRVSARIFLTVLSSVAAVLLFGMQTGIISPAAGVAAPFAAVAPVQQWVARYNGPGNGYDEAHAIATDSAGNVYVTGWSAGDYATVKYNGLGVEQWAARYNGPGNATDYASALAVDGSGNVYVTGGSAGSGTSNDYATVKYDALGVQQWVARYNGPVSGTDYASALAVDGSGNVYVTGWSPGSGTGVDYATLKYDASNGAQQWVARYNGPANAADQAYALALDGSGNVYVTGYSAGSGTSDDYATVKYDALGVEQWVARYNGPGNWTDQAIALAVDGPSNVYVTGLSFGSGTGNDYATVKYNASNGAQQWVARYNGPANATDHAYAQALDGSGNVYVTGYSLGSGTGFDYATVKYDATGVEQWVARYDGPGTAFDGAYALAVDGTGNVYVTGSSQGSGTGYDYATLKYAQVEATPTPTASNTPTATSTSTSSPTPTCAATSTPTATSKPGDITPTATSTPGDITPTSTITPCDITPTATSRPTDTPTPTRTSTPTSTPYSTPSGGNALQGWLSYLSGRPDKSGVLVALSGTTTLSTTKTASDGAYTMTDLAPGSYTVTLSFPSFLFTRKTGVPITANQTTVLPDAALYAGDLKVDANNRVDLFDLILLGGNWQNTSPTSWSGVPIETTSAGTITGKVSSLQGRANLDGAQVCVGPFTRSATAESCGGPVATRPVATTDSGGAYTVTGLSAGAYTVTVFAPGYLYAQRGGVNVTASAGAMLPDAQLKVGDLKLDNNNRVNLFDLILLGQSWNKTAPTSW